jgi:hypothetical protein
MAETNALWVLEPLKHALQALAMPATIQIALFPDFVCKADELALDFDNYREAVITNEAFSLTQAQRDSLEGINVRLDAISGLKKH